MCITIADTFMKNKKNQPVRHPDNTVVAITCKKSELADFDEIVEQMDLSRSQLIRRLMRNATKAYKEGREVMPL